MGPANLLWSFTKKFFTCGVIGLTVSDQYASVMPVRGHSMSPSFNPEKNTLMGLSCDDYVLVEKLCLHNYRFFTWGCHSFLIPLGLAHGREPHSMASSENW